MPALVQPATTAPPPAPARRGRRGGLACPAALGLAALALYAATASPGVQWQDSGIHQWRIVTGQVENPLGLALAHPLHYYLGRAALRVPLGDPLRRLNLLAAACGALGVAVLAGLVLRLTRSHLAAALAAAALALAHSYWQMSVLTEVYTLAAALLTLEWACLLRYARGGGPAWLVAVFALNGLHVADHLLGLLPLATYAGLAGVQLVRRRIGPGWLAAAALAWLIGAAPYGALIVGHALRTGDLAGTLHSALFGGSPIHRGWADEVLNVRLSAAQVRAAALALGYCFPSLAGPVAILGLVRRARGRARLLRRVLLAQTLIVGVFVGRYAVRDVYTFFVPVCVLLALWFGIGVRAVLHRCRRPATRRAWAAVLIAGTLCPPLVYAAFPGLARARGWLAGRVRDIPFRDEYDHFLRPWRRGDDSAGRLAQAALDAAGPHGWVLADGTTAPPIAVSYLVYGGPPGVRVFWNRLALTGPPRPPLAPEELRGEVEQGRVVIAVPSADVQALLEPPLALEPAGDLSRIVRRPDPP